MDTKISAKGCASTIELAELAQKRINIILLTALDGVTVEVPLGLMRTLLKEAELGRAMISKKKHKPNANSTGESEAARAELGQ